MFAKAPRRGPLERTADAVRQAAGSDVAVVLDLSGPVGCLAISGAPIECTPEKEALLMAWIQESDDSEMRPTPPKLLMLFGCLDILVVPIQTPATRLGAIAVSLPLESRHATRVVEAMAAEIALEMEGEDRRACRERLRASDGRTEPAPPHFEDVA